MDRPLNYASENGKPSLARIRLFIGKGWTTVWVTDLDWLEGWGALASADGLALHVSERWSVLPSKMVLIVEDLNGQHYHVTFPQSTRLDPFAGAPEPRLIMENDALEIVAQGF